MTNNDVLRNLRDTFSYDNAKVISIFSLVDGEASEVQVSGWLEKADAPGFKNLNDTNLSIFLNGLICELRGKKEGPLPKPDKIMNNNLVLKKVKIALNLKNEDLLEILESSGLKIDSYELTSFFRKWDHKNYRSCKNNVLRAFLKGVKKKYQKA